MKEKLVFIVTLFYNKVLNQGSPFEAGRRSVFSIACAFTARRRLNYSCCYNAIIDLVNH